MDPTIIVGLVAQLVQIAADAVKNRQADAAAVLAQMQQAITDAQSQIRAMPGELAENDAAADADAAKLP